MKKGPIKVLEGRCRWCGGPVAVNYKGYKRLYKCLKCLKKGWL